MSSRPNILYIHSHDTGRYISPYGHPVETPNLQRFAEEGVLFRQAFCAAPTCSPSRAALLTGRYPHSNGMIGLAHRGARLNDYSQHLAAFLAEHGYETALSGMQHEIDHSERAKLGYARFLDDESTPDLPDWNAQTAHRAAAYLGQQHDGPFFLSCGFFLTHRTGTGIQWHNDDASPLGDARYVRPPAPLPDTPEIRQDFADFREAVNRLDIFMGVVLDSLAKHNLAENTLVICTTDHGIAYPGMKCNLTDGGMGVLLMLRGPGGFAGGKVVDALVSHVDLYPTVCEAAGISAPEWLQGHSLQPLITGAAETIRDAVFAEVNYHAAPEPMRAVRTDRYKYIRRFDAPRTPVLPNCDDSITKNLFLADGWCEQLLPTESLFDLIFDPYETCNLIDDPSHAVAAQAMRKRLGDWMGQTDDPILTGRVEPWPGMVVNSADGNSPQEPTVPAEPILAYSF
jgi:arylsulfatase A-like enzyme